MTQLSLVVKSCQGHRYNQTDPPPRSLLRDGENLLKIARNSPEVEGRALGGVRGFGGFRGARGGQGTVLVPGERPQLCDGNTHFTAQLNRR